MSIWAILGLALVAPYARPHRPIDPMMWLVIIAGIAGVGYLGWTGIRNLVQANLLRSWKRLSLAGMDGRAAALRGRVKVREVVRIGRFGECLWYRELVQTMSGFGRHRHWVTQSDLKTCADFSLVVGDEEVRVAGEPTEVHGKGSTSVRDSPGFVDRFLGERDERVTEEWLPVLDDLTVVGRLRRVTGGWEIGPDPGVGLLFSAQVPTRAALKETVKGILGIAGALAGLAALVIFATR